MKLKTRLLSLAVCVVLLLSVVPTVTALAATPISYANLNGFKLPVVGQSSASNLKNLSVPAGAHYSIASAYWVDTLTRHALSETETFKADTPYYLSVYIEPNFGYTFQTGDVAPQLDGSQAYVDTAYCTVTSKGQYSILSKDILSSAPVKVTTVNVTGLQAPVVGQKVSDNLKNLSVPNGAHYSIAAAYWVDTLARHALSETETFKADTPYYLSVYIEPDYGYTFRKDDIVPQLDGSQANVDAAYCTVTSKGQYSILSKDILSSASVKVTTVNVTGFQAPVVGQKVSDNLKKLSVPNGAHYAIADAFWIDKEGGARLEGTASFAAGHTYYLRVDLAPGECYAFNVTSPQLNGSAQEVDTDFTWMSENVLVFYSIDITIPDGKKGDVNGDGVVNAFDYQMVKAYVLGTFPGATSAQIAAMDVNGDGIVNAFDYQMLKAAVLGTYTL